MHWVRTNISSIYYFTEIPIILKQHIQSDWITNELRKPRGDVLGTLSAHGYSKLWRTSFSMNKPTTWCKSGRVSLVSSSCLYKTQPERALAQVYHTRIDALSPDKYQFHLLLHRNTDGQTDRKYHSLSCLVAAKHRCLLISKSDMSSMFVVAVLCLYAISSYQTVL